MADDLHDIDPEVVQKVLEHADEFLNADARVDEIMAWADQELQAREDRIIATGGALEDFRKAAQEVEAQVAQKLQALEAEVRARTP